jgi:hypothetical protein
MYNCFSVVLVFLILVYVRLVFEVQCLRFPFQCCVSDIVVSAIVV